MIIPNPTTLIFHHGALGDSIIPYPLYRTLATASNPITLIAPAAKAKLAAHLIPHITPLDGDALRFSRLFAPASPDDIDPDLRNLFQSAVRIISYVASPDHPWANNVRALAPNASLNFVEPNPPEGDPCSTLQFHLDQLASQGLALTPQQPIAHHNPAGLIIIHPGAGSPKKCWPHEHFQSLLRHLVNANHTPCILLGEVELERLAPAALDFYRDNYSTLIHPSLTQLADYFATALAYIGNDSGPAHLAAQCGLPTLALFGPTCPKQWAPQGPQVKILAPPTPQPITWLDAKTVINAASELIPCPKDEISRPVR